ncbi:MAG: DUF4350 domain-containing protein [Planctomycetota bacterium]
MPADEVTPFAARTTGWLLGVSLLSLGASLWLLMRPGTDDASASVDADGYSRSAIGHFGLLQFLRHEGEVVVQSRLPRGPGPCGLYVIAEPRELHPTDVDRLAAHVANSPATLVVLPKREGIADPTHPAWIVDYELLAEVTVTETLDHAGKWADEPAPRLVRSDLSGWRLPDGWPEPVLLPPVQLLDPAGDRIAPVIACEQGVLLGRIGEILVLSDPDLLANHGLPLGDNGALVLAIVRANKQDGAIVFDETVHGRRLDPSIWHLAGQFPFVLITGHLLLLLAVVAWVAHGRFGPVLPAAVPIAAGKRFLIDNIAALLTRAGNAGPSLRRYGRQRLRRAADALRLPRGLADEQCRNHVLARLPEPARSQLATSLERANTNLSGREAVAAARRIRQLTEGFQHART